MKREQIVLRTAQAWILLLVVGSLQPSRPGSVVGLHREIHWLAFAGAAFLLLAASRNRRQEIRSTVALFLLGPPIEYLQHLIYRNPMEWWDVRDDTLTILAAFALYRLVGARKPAPDPPG